VKITAHDAYRDNLVVQALGTAVLLAHEVDHGMSRPDWRVERKKALQGAAFVGGTGALVTVLVLALLFAVFAYSASNRPNAEPGVRCPDALTVRDALERSDFGDIAVLSNGVIPELSEEPIESPSIGDGICHWFRWEEPTEPPRAEGRVSIRVYDQASAAARYADSLDDDLEYEAYGPLQIVESGGLVLKTGTFHAFAYIGCVYMSFVWFPDRPTDSEVTAMFDRLTLETLDVSQQVCL
jgi:hypothetical protein